MDKYPSMDINGDVNGPWASGWIRGETGIKGWKLVDKSMVKRRVRGEKEEMVWEEGYIRGEKLYYIPCVSLVRVWVPLRYECLPMGVSSHIDWNEGETTRGETLASICPVRGRFTVTRISWEAKRRKRGNRTTREMVMEGDMGVMGE